MAFSKKQMLPGEEVLLSKFANLWVRPSEYGMSEFPFGGLGDNESIGGKAVLTNYRVVFAAHAFNRLVGTHSLFLPNIREVRKGWTSLRITTETQEYGFVMWFNRRFYNAVEDEREAFGRKELRRLQDLVREHFDKVSKGLQVNEVAGAVSDFLAGVQEPFKALAGLVASLPVAEQRSALEAISLLRKGQRKEK